MGFVCQVTFTLRVCLSMKISLAYRKIKCYETGKTGENEALQPGDKIWEISLRIRIYRIAILRRASLHLSEISFRELKGIDPYRVSIAHPAVSRECRIERDTTNGGNGRQMALIN